MIGGLRLLSELEDQATQTCAWRRRRRRRLLATRPGGRTRHRLTRPRGDDCAQASPAYTRPRRRRVAARPHLR